ncbi:MAG: ammonium transporter [Deltaproteobacteria bacterium]|nr:ammonium transporter [Deltaproteobacteria bacterium]
MDKFGISGADTGYVLICAALVLLMTPALAFFYGGMVRSKNVLNTLAKSLMAAGVIGVQWVLFGYSLSFSKSSGALAPFIGGLSWLGLRNVGLAPNADYAATIPHQAFMIYQGMFAIITPALMSGAFVERVNFRGYILLILGWATLVYDPLAHWVWGANGWLHDLGALDFAGGTVVHISAGVSALVVCLMIGKRSDFGKAELAPHNLPLTVLGAGLLWFGWFGFNSGSALAANATAAQAFVTTQIAAAAGVLGWAVVDYRLRGKITVLGIASGCVAGLVGITPAAGFVGPMAALFIGVAGGLVSAVAVHLRSKSSVDDSLDVFSVHGTAGILGSLLTGVFAAGGLLEGHPKVLAIQIVAVLATVIFSAIMTFGIVKGVDALVGLRVSAEDEEHGLDFSQHGEQGYYLAPGRLIVSVPVTSTDAGPAIPGSSAASGLLPAIRRPLEGVG